MILKGTTVVTLLRSSTVSCGVPSKVNYRPPSVRDQTKYIEIVIENESMVNAE